MYMQIGTITANAIKINDHFSNLLNGIVLGFWLGLIICWILAFILLKNDTPK